VFVRDEQNLQVCLGDFGLAKQTMRKTALNQTTAGTPLYLAPEQMKSEPYNDKADIWSLGVLFYELAALDYPFMADSALALAKVVVEQKHKPLASNYSTLLRDLVECMLEKEPQKRPTMFALINSEFFFSANNAQEMLQTIRQTYIAKPQEYQPYQQQAVIKEAPPIIEDFGAWGSIKIDQSNVNYDNIFGAGGSTYGTSTVQSINVPQPQVPQPQVPAYQPQVGQPSPASNPYMQPAQPSYQQPSYQQPAYQPPVSNYQQPVS